MTNHVIAVGLAFGDEGKGSIVDYLCSPYVPDPAQAVVRFNGGSQAGHNVVTGDGRHHCFAQFGSGTLQGARTHLSRFMMTDPLTLIAEAARLEETGVRDPFSLLTIDPGALLITPYHVAANRTREQARGTARHGSCGMGIGETAAYAAAYPEVAPRFGDLLTPRVLSGKLAVLRDYLGLDAGLTDPYDGIAGRLLSSPLRKLAGKTAVADADVLPGLLAVTPVVFEGAQGVLLDERHGFLPHVTWSDTTFANAETLLGEYGVTAVRLGVVRTWMTRHGAGPFVTEDPALALPELHNVTGPWQGRVRQGHFDAVALRYALDIAGADAIAVTHADTAARGGLRMCRAWRDDTGQRLYLPGDLWASPGLTALAGRCQPVYGPGPADWPGAIGQALRTPVMVISSGPDAGAKADTRQLTG